MIESQHLFCIGQAVPADRDPIEKRLDFWKDERIAFEGGSVIDEVDTSAFGHEQCPPFVWGDVRCLPRCSYGRRVIPEQERRLHVKRADHGHRCAR